MSEELLNQTQFTEQPRGSVAPVVPTVATAIEQKPKGMNKKVVIGVVVGAVLLVSLLASIFLSAPKKQVVSIPQDTPIPTVAPSPPTYLQEMVNNLEPVVKNSDPQTNPNPFPPVNMRIRMKEPKAQ